MSIKCCVFVCQRMYLLKQLKSQGLGIKGLHTVFTALIVLRVLYALPAWGGFLSSDLNEIWCHAAVKLISLAATDVVIGTDMLQNADNKFFSLMFRSGHCLHTLLHDLKMIDIVLRSSGTSFNSPGAIINCTNNRSSIDVFSLLIVTCFAVFCTLCFTFSSGCIILSFSLI